MPARHAKPTGGAEPGTPAASSRPKRSASMTETPTDNDPQQAHDPMDTADQDTETQATSVADAEEDFLSPDEGPIPLRRRVAPENSSGSRKGAGHTHLNGEADRKPAGS
ncbi:hypothetical protein MTO96_019612 [Rhipicephalus appendiculatus]